MYLGVLIHALLAIVTSDSRQWMAAQEVALPQITNLYPHPCRNVSRITYYWSESREFTRDFAMAPGVRQRNQHNGKRDLKKLSGRKPLGMGR